MANKLYIMLLSLMLAIGIAGCSDEYAGGEQLQPGTPGTLTIRFKSSDLSRSTESDNSENLIDKVFIALYEDGSEETIAPVYTNTFVIQKQTEASVTVNLTNDMVEKLFLTPKKTQCRIYAVANLPDGSSIQSDKPTIAQLKSIAVTSPFKSVAVQPSFVMWGTGMVGYTASETEGSLGTASGTCTLRRAAAKISLNVKLPESITVTNTDGETETTEIWEPVTGEGNIIAYINNGVQSAIVYPVNESADEVEPWKPTGDNAAEAYYNSDPTKVNTYRLFKGNGSVTEEEIEYTTGVDGTITETKKEIKYDVFNMDVPFYTYPNAWTKNNYEDVSQTTLTLIVRWHKENETTWTNYYYQVPVTPTELQQIDANHSYTINLKVGMLGSLVPDVPLEVPATYQVISWYSETVNVNINDYRYLVVNPNVISVQNEAEVLIPFYSSHPVDIENITMTFQRFNFYSDGNGTVVDIEVPQTKLDASVYEGQKMVTYELVTDPNSNQKYLKINHPLEMWTPVNNNSQTITAGNTVSLTGNSGNGNQTLENVTNSINHFNRPANPEAPYSPYVFNVHIQHEDNENFAADITVTQYPAMYIEAKRNPGNGNPNYNAGGNVFVNGGYYQGGNNYNPEYYLGSITTAMGENASRNANPNMYVINVTQLDVSSDYVIGDPRTEYYNNSLTTNNNADLTTPTQNGVIAGKRTGNVDYSTNANWCEESPALYPSTAARTLSYYYPTIEEESYKYRIAPKFRVASSYGKTQPVNRNGARRRMATYQELDCPAGRWRLPTYGELEFIITLSNTGKIPVLYSSDTYYWTAQGACYVNDDGTIKLNKNQTRNVYCRGVYDEWYWENYPQYSITPTGTNYTYTLGDVPRGAQ